MNLNNIIHTFIKNKNLLDTEARLAFLLSIQLHMSDQQTILNNTQENRDTLMHWFE